MTNELRHRTTRQISEGKPYPLGASLRNGGVNFALYSQCASEVFLLLFDDPGGKPTDVIKVQPRTHWVWHTFVHGLRPGQLYGYKVRGDHNPRAGLRFNEHKLVVDPYARALTGEFRNVDNLLLAYDPQSPDRDLAPDDRDNTAIAPKCVVIKDDFDWQGDARPDIPFADLVIYEVHVKGFTAHASSKVLNRGTYLGFLEKIPYLTQLGVNAVELLPVHDAYTDDFLAARGLTNYWGYNTVAFFAPEAMYGTRRAPGCEVAEFKTLVRELHRAGIEVILDVVYNHTAEGNELGPTMAFKGIDNPTYYALSGGPHDPYRYYVNHTGCGNTLNLANPAVIRLVMDSLRYWVEVMHVDGFRFDLASVLGRESGGFFNSASFFDAISQDPVLSRVKLIAEPWDLGTYQVGNFPVDWSEWNGRFRDTMRRFGKGDAGQACDLATRLTGSADLYGDDGRSAYNSINFVTCHDGFTLHDLVSYDTKHNDANLENNRDGADDNSSWNCGVEGDTDDASVLRLRRQLAKNQACYLLLSAGTPMILGGDEFLRTQRGNNNAYCQDNEISWFDWNAADRNRDMFTFVQKLIAFRRRHPIFRRTKFFTGRDSSGDKIPDIQWFGLNLDAPAWSDQELRALCYQLDEREADVAATSALFFVILNADHRTQWVRLPRFENGTRWYRVIDTSLEGEEDFRDEDDAMLITPADQYIANGRSTVVLLGK